MSMHVITLPTSACHLQKVVLIFLPADSDDVIILSISATAEISFAGTQANLCLYSYKLWYMPNFTRIHCLSQLLLKKDCFFLVTMFVWVLSMCVCMFCSKKEYSIHVCMFFTWFPCASLDPRLWDGSLAKIMWNDSGILSSVPCVGIVVFWWRPMWFTSVSFLLVKKHAYRTERLLDVNSVAKEPVTSCRILGVTSKSSYCWYHVTQSEMGRNSC